MAGRKQATMTSAALLLLLLGLLAMAAVALAASPPVCRVNVDVAKGACEKYYVRGSREVWPSKECCDAVWRADFKCACRWKRKFQFLIPRSVDVGRGMQIPSKCGIPGAPTKC